MPSSYPTGLDAFTTGTLTGTVGGADHGNKADAINKIEAELGISPSSGQATVAARLDTLTKNVKDYGAAGTGAGAGDQTSFFNAARDAAGVGGTIYVPPGTYYVKDFDLLSRQTLVGCGTASILAPRSDAAYVVRLSGLLSCKVEGLWIDGIGLAAVKGMVITGSASASSQGHLCERLYITSCVTGISVEQGTVSQADKNTYINCHLADNTGTGMKINSVNAQEQVLINCNIDGSPLGVDVTAGCLHMLGGQFQGCTTAAIKFSGSNVQEVRLEGVITEGCNIDIDGTTHWCGQPLILDICTMAGDVNTVKMGVAGSYLIGHGCRFNNTPLVVTGSDCAFYDEFCSFTLGATLDSSGATSFRYYKLALNGWTLANGSQTIDIQPHLGIDISEIAEPANPAANTGRLFTKDNGSGKTQLCVRFASGATQVISTEP